MKSKNEKSLSPRGYFPLSPSLNDNDSTLQCIWKSPVDMIIIYKSHDTWQSVNKIRASLQMTGQVVEPFYQKLVC